MLRALAQSPTVYSVMSRLMLPRARESAAFARRKIWLAYILAAALCQGWVGHQQIPAVVNAGWILVTVALIGGLIAFFRRLPDLIHQAMARVRFSDLLVFWVRGDLFPRSWHAEHVAPVPGDADPARPLSLRI